MGVEGYDLVMLGILAAAAVLGYFKGIVWQLAWIAGIAASAVVALRFGGPLAPFFGSQAPWNRLVAMLALYAATSMAVWLVFSVVSGLIKTVKLSAFDHQMGLLLGLAKGVLLCIVLTFFAVTLTPNYRDQILASRSGRLVAELIVKADQILPPDVVAAVAPFVERFENELNKPAGGPLAGQAAAASGTPSPFEAIWEGVQSAAAWTGVEPGGQGGSAGSLLSRQGASHQLAGSRCRQATRPHSRYNLNVRSRVGFRVSRSTSRRQRLPARSQSAPKRRFRCGEFRG